jgi:hypothetical protein
VLTLGGPAAPPFERLPYVIRSSWEEVARTWEETGEATLRRGAKAILAGVGLALAATLGGFLFG